MSKEPEPIEPSFNPYFETLAKKTSPLDDVPPEQLDQARIEFSEMPEVAGIPLTGPDET